VSQLTQAPRVWTQPTHPQGEVTPAASGATPNDGAIPDVAGSWQAAMATLSLDQLGPRGGQGT
jgi:hypothetical protein